MEDTRPASPELQFQVNFTTTGIYHVWVRAFPIMIHKTLSTPE